MKLSVLTVCYNSEKTIRHTVESFLAQDYPDKEMIIIDGASTDGTLEVIDRYRDDQIRVISETDEGMYDALNKGLRLFSGDAFGVLHSDDTYHDDSALSRVAEALKEADIIHGHLNFVDNHENKKVVRYWHAEERPENGFRTGWMPAHTTVHVRREVAEHTGPFDCSLTISADYDWMVRAIDVHGFKTKRIDVILTDMAVGGKSTAGLVSHLRHNWQSLKARRKWLGSGSIDYALFAKPARKISQYLVKGGKKG